MFDAVQRDVQPLRIKRLKKVPVAFLKDKKTDDRYGETIRDDKFNTPEVLIRLEQIYDKLFDGQLLISKDTNNHSTKDLRSENYIEIGTDSSDPVKMVALLCIYEDAITVLNEFILGFQTTDEFDDKISAWSSKFAVKIETPTANTLIRVLSDVYEHVDDQNTVMKKKAESLDYSAIFRKTQYDMLGEYMDLQTYVDALSYDHVSTMYNEYTPSAPPLDEGDDDFYEGSTDVYPAQQDDRKRPFAGHGGLGARFGLKFNYGPTVTMHEKFARNYRTYKQSADDNDESEYREEREENSRSVFNLALKSISAFLTSSYNKSSPNALARFRSSIIVLRLFCMKKLAARSCDVSPTRDFVYDWSFGDNFSMSLVLDYVVLMRDYANIAYFVSKYVVSQTSKNVDTFEDLSLFDYASTFSCENKTKEDTFNWMNWNLRDASKNTRADNRKYDLEHSFSSTFSRFLKTHFVSDQSTGESSRLNGSAQSYDRTEYYESNFTDVADSDDRCRIKIFKRFIREQGLSNVFKTVREPYLEWILHCARDNNNAVSGELYESLEHCINLAKSAKQRMECATDIACLLENLCSKKIIDRNDISLSLFEHSVRYASNLRLYYGLWLRRERKKKRNRDTSYDYGYRLGSGDRDKEEEEEEEDSQWLSEKYDISMDLYDLGSEDFYSVVVELSRFLSILSAYKILKFASVTDDAAKKKSLGKMYQKTLSTAFRTKFAVDEYTKTPQRHAGKFLKLLYCLGVTATCVSPTVREVVLNLLLDEASKDSTNMKKSGGALKKIKDMFDETSAVYKVLFETGDPRGNVSPKYDAIFRAAWSTFQRIIKSDGASVIEWFCKKSFTEGDSQFAASNACDDISKCFWYGYDGLDDDEVIKTYRCAEFLAESSLDTGVRHSETVSAFWCFARFLNGSQQIIVSDDTIVSNASKYATHKSYSDILSVMCAHYLSKTMFFCANSTDWSKSNHFVDRYFDHRYLVKLEGFKKKATESEISTVDRENVEYRSGHLNAEFEHAFEIPVPISEVESRFGSNVYYDTMSSYNVEYGDNRPGSCDCVIRYYFKTDGESNNVILVLDTRKKYANKRNYKLKSILEFDMVYLRNLTRSNAHNLKSIEPRTLYCESDALLSFINSFTSFSNRSYASHPLSGCNVDSLLANGLQKKTDTLKSDLSKMERGLNRYGLESNVYDSCRRSECSAMGCAHIQYVADVSVINVSKTYVSNDGVYVIDNPSIVLRSDDVRKYIINNGQIQRYFESITKDKFMNASKFIERMRIVRFGLTPAREDNVVFSQTVKVDVVDGKHKHTRRKKERPVDKVHDIATREQPINERIVQNPILDDNIDYGVPYRCLMLGLYFKRRFCSKICRSETGICTTEHLLSGTRAQYLDAISSFSVTINEDRMVFGKRLMLDDRNASFKPKSTGASNHSNDKKSSEFVSEMVDVALRSLPARFSEYYARVLPNNSELRKTIADCSSLRLTTETVAKGLQHTVYFQNSSKNGEYENQIYALLCLLK